MSTLAHPLRRGAPSAETVIGRRAGAALLALLLATLTAVGVLLAHELRQRRWDALAAHLSIAVQIGVAEVAREAAQAQTSATTLAARPAVQRALRHGDRRALAALTRPIRGAVAVPAPQLLAPPRGPAIRREVRVVSGRRFLGTVAVTLPLDRTLLARLHRIAGLAPAEQLAFGPPAAGGVAVSAPLVGGPAGARLVAAAPASELEAPLRRQNELLALCLAMTLAALLALARLLARPVLEPLAALARQARSSVVDELTQLPNRRAFVESGTRELLRAKRSGRTVSVAMLDVDDFKHVNDTWGHAAGDHVLQVVADVLRAELREIDLPARYGGEEFAVVLPETTTEGAEEAAERLRSALARRTIGDGRTRPQSVTASIGVAASADATLDELVGAADAALYRAKAAGKNRVAT